MATQDTIADHRTARPTRLVASLVADADRLIRLELELARREARDVMLANRAALAMLVAAAVLATVGLTVALPTLLVVLLPWHWEVAAAWLVAFVGAAAVLAPRGRRRLRLAMPETTASVKEFETWVMNEARSLGR